MTTRTRLFLLPILLGACAEAPAPGVPATLAVIPKASAHAVRLAPRTLRPCGLSVPWEQLPPGAMPEAGGPGLSGTPVGSSGMSPSLQQGVGGLIGAQGTQIGSGGLGGRGSGLGGGGAAEGLGASAPRAAAPAPLATGTPSAT